MTQTNFIYMNEQHAREDLKRFSEMNRYDGRPLILIELREAGGGLQIVTEIDNAMNQRPLMIALNGVVYT